MANASAGSFESRWVRDLAEHSENLTVVGNRLIVDEIETPYDEYGIVDKRELFSRIIGSVAADHVWKGSYEGPHHIMWPRYAYQGISPQAFRPKATHFRGSPSLKIIIPRQMHDYLHFVTEPPAVPDKDVMVQYSLEQFNVQRLYDTIRFHGALHLDKHTPEERERIRWETLLDKLDTMDDPQVGLMPEKESIVEAGITYARQALRAIARTQGLSNHPNCQNAFFNPPVLDDREQQAA